MSSDQLTEVPTAVKAIFWVLLAIAIAAYAIGWVVQIVRGKKLRRENGIGSNTSLEPMSQRSEELFSGGHTY